ncbi:hypothetical protein B0H19DRAFT_1247654 [Mycena capillaripes]|nr:hypothetical protein B0H19DRAFT_1247654 [Mycena capillaripes]
MHESQVFRRIPHARGVCLRPGVVWTSKPSLVARRDRPAGRQRSPTVPAPKTSLTHCVCVLFLSVSSHPQPDQHPIPCALPSTLCIPSRPITRAVYMLSFLPLLPASWDETSPSLCAPRPLHSGLSLVVHPTTLFSRSDRNLSLYRRHMVLGSSTLYAEEGSPPRSSRAFDSTRRGVRVLSADPGGGCGTLRSR